MSYSSSSSSGNHHGSGKDSYFNITQTSTSGVGEHHIRKETGADEDDTGIVEIPETVSSFFDSLVGIFMILLGAYSMHKAYERRWYMKPDHDNNSSQDVMTDELIEAGLTVLTTCYTEMPDLDSTPDEQVAILPGHCRPPSYLTTPGDTTNNAMTPMIRSEQAEDITPAESVEARQYHRHPHNDHTHDHCPLVCTSLLSPRTMALLSGVIHGMAGPGGVLGVIPAVQLHDGKLSACYLASFCLASTCTMGMYAALFAYFSGGISHCLHNLYFVELASAGLSIAVGIAWLILISIGKLDDIFP